MNLCVGFQVQEKQLRCLFNIRKQTWLSVSLSIPQYLIVTRCGWHTLASTMNFLPQGMGFSSHRCCSMYNQDVFGLSLFLHFSLPACIYLHEDFPGPEPNEELLPNKLAFKLLIQLELAYFITTEILILLT